LPKTNGSSAVWKAPPLIGTSALPRLATGGAVSFLDVGLGGGDGTATLVLIGAFVDGYLLPNSGFHLGGQLGVASSHVRPASDVDEFDGGGLAASLWLGHDFEVAPAWAVGGLLRFNAATARDPDHGEFEDPVSLRASTFQLALELTAVYY
jgi:hypothetical protein